MSRVTFEGKLANEIILETFDFTSRLTAAEAISTASVAATCYSGVDTASNQVVGTATIAGKKVTQKIGGGVLGVTYVLKCTITTSLGQTLSLSAFLVIVPDQA